MASSISQCSQHLSSVPRPPGASSAGAAEQRSFVTRLMLRFGLPPADAEDAAHDVFLISCRRQHELASREDRHGWLYLAARNVSRNRRRSLRREAARRSYQHDLPQRGGARDGATALVEPAADDAGVQPDQWLAARQLGELLAEGLEQLSDEQRNVVRGALDGQSPAELARELDAPVATIASRLRMSRLALRRHLHRRGWPLGPAATALQRAA